MYRYELVTVQKINNKKIIKHGKMFRLLYSNRLTPSYIFLPSCKSHVAYTDKSTVLWRCNEVFIYIQIISLFGGPGYTFHLPNVLISNFPNTRHSCSC